MTFTQAFKTWATPFTNSDIQDNTRQDDHILATYDTLLGSNHSPWTDLEVSRVNRGQTFFREMLYYF